MDGFTDGQLTEELLVEIELLKVSLNRRMEESTEREMRHKTLIAELADALDTFENIRQDHMPIAKGKEPACSP